MPGRRAWFEIALAVIVLSATLFAAFSDAYNLPNRWFIRDDAYYYFKVAQNISEGRGSTFDGIHITNGYHPLWLAISVPIFALARIDLILPLRILALLIGALQAATAILLYRLIRDTISEVAGVLAACFWAFNTHILVFLYKTGVESSVTLFLVLVLLHALHRFEKTWRTRPPSLRQIAGLAALAVLVTFGRLDLAFFCLIVGIWIVFRDTPARFYLPFDLLALVIATVSAFVMRLGFAAYYDSQQAVTIMLVAEIVCKIPVFFLFGLYGKPSSGRRGQYLARLVLAVAVGSSLPALVLLGGSAAGVLPVYSRAILLLEAAVTLGLVLGIRLGAVFFGTRSGPAGNLSSSSELREHGRRWLREGAVFYGILGGMLAAYMLWNQLAFGTPTPVSGQIKHWWGTFTHSIYGTSAGSWLTFFALNPF
ncbi:MAG TPA: hypothetical protein VLL49_12370, partial [Anaerolineales bacterium]|nr:hypothetical protein [Anaerolineales bacterium]